VLTRSEAAAYLRLPEHEAVRLVREQALPARQLGADWRFPKAAIQGWLGQPLPPRPDFWEAWAGAFQGDPHLSC
jgi:excisionase family DNA binding protein